MYTNNYGAYKGAILLIQAQYYGTFWETQNFNVLYCRFLFGFPLPISVMGRLGGSVCKSNIFEIILT